MTPTPIQVDPRPFPGPLRSQRGTALVLAISMLAIMSILGALALNTSETELGISTNYRAAQEAFFAAERAVEYSSTHWDIYDRPTSSFPVTLANDGDGTANEPEDHADNIAAGTGRSGLYIPGGGAPNPNQVDFLRAGPLPPGSGSDPTYFQARYYIITVRSEGPNNAEARVESQVARIVPTGGG